MTSEETTRCKSGTILRRVSVYLDMLITNLDTKNAYDKQNTKEPSVKTRNKKLEAII